MIEQRFYDPRRQYVPDDKQMTQRRGELHQPAACPPGLKIDVSDRRTSHRIKQILPVVVTFRDQHKKQKVFTGQTRNVCMGGLSVVMEQSLPQADKGVIEVCLPAAFSSFKERIRITWRDDSERSFGVVFAKSEQQTSVDWKMFLGSVQSPIHDRRQGEKRRVADHKVDQNHSNSFRKRRTIRRLSDLWREETLDCIDGSSIKKSDLIPRQKNADYTTEAAEARRQWLSLKTGTSLKHIGVFSEDPYYMRGNIENFIGVAQVPIGIAGPLRINGQFAKGDFYVPMATTEGVLIYTYNQGMQLISLAGGAITTLLKDETHISPIFVFDSVKGAQVFTQWLENNFKRIKELAERTTKHGKLVKLEPYIFDRNVVVKFCYITGDAMGQNMVTFATEEACKYIVSSVKIKKFYTQSNFSSNKKVAMHNFVTGYGKTVIAEIVIPASLIKRVFGITPEHIVEFYHLVKLTTTHAGMIGINGHTANALAAIFIACGQDAASVVDSYVGVTNFEVTDDRSLYVSLKLPSLVIGTVGGGTDLATQRECLSLLGCYGAGGSKKFSEIIIATVLAGEIAICARVANGTFADGHKKHGRKSQNSLPMKAMP